MTKSSTAFFPRSSVALLCALLIGSLFNACKKAEQPSDSRAGAEATTTTQVAPEPTQPTEPAGDAVALKAKWPVGARRVYRMDLDQHSTNRFPQMPNPLQQNVVMAMVYGISVIKETEGGGREIELEFLASEMEMKMGEQLVLSFDSKEPPTEEAGMAAMISAPFRKMIGSKIRMQLDAEGKVESVLNLEEWLKNLGGEGPAQGMLGQQFNEGYFRQIADMTTGLPPKPVRVGDVWPHQMELPAGPMGKIGIEANITYKGNEERDGRECAVMEMAGTFKGAGGGESGANTGPISNLKIEEGKLAGTSWFDPALGALVHATNSQSMRLTGNLPTPPPAPGGAPRPDAAPNQFVSEIAQAVIMQLVESTDAAKLEEQ